MALPDLVHGGIEVLFLRVYFCILCALFYYSTNTYSCLVCQFLEGLVVAAVAFEVLHQHRKQNRPITELLDSLYWGRKVREHSTSAGAK